MSVTHHPPPLFFKTHAEWFAADIGTRWTGRVRVFVPAPDAFLASTFGPHWRTLKGDAKELLGLELEAPPLWSSSAKLRSAAGILPCPDPEIQKRREWWNFRTH